MTEIDINLEKKLQKSYFDVLGLCCSSEIPLVEKILRSMDGVKDFSVIIPTKTVIVVHDNVIITQVQIVKALNQARLEANIRVKGEKNYKNRWPSPYAIISGVLLVMSFLKYFYSPFKWLALGAVAVGIPPILLKAVTAIFINRRPFDINTLVLIAVAGSIALQDYWEAGTIVFLFTIAEWLETRASHKATAAMSSLVNLVPQKAIIADTGEEVNADEVKLNTLLAVKTGETIPIDGVVVEGNCEVDEKNLTGESFPVSKEKDSSVWASTINLNGYITIKTSAVAEDCVVARMAKLVEEAQNRKSKIQRFIDKCAKYYTPSILVISGSVALVPLALHVHNKKDWFRLALVVLVSGCPCALLLSTPVAMFCALSRAAMMGVLFKGAEYLETLAQIKIVAFDKTGTITRAEFIVVDVKSLQQDFDLEKMLYWISSIESKSSHPMANALIDFARTEGIEPKPDQVDRFQNFAGEGICGFIDNHEIYIGNSKIASRTACTKVPSLEGYEVEGKSVGYVFIDSSPACVFFLSDVCRTGAKEAIQELKSLGIKAVMLTGDCDAAAKHTQWQLSNALEAIHSELLPEDKARIIKQLETEGPTAMVGDGVNDALALTTAKIGISMGVSGSALATESGDIILMSNDIQRIPKAVRLARRVKRKIIENVVISILTKAGILGLAIAGHPLVWAAVLTDVGTCLLVIFNSMLLLRQTPTKKKNCCQSKAKSGHSSCSDIESQKSCAPRSCSSQKCASKCSSAGSTSMPHGVNGCSSTKKDHEHEAHHDSHDHKAHHHLHEHKSHHDSHEHKGHHHPHEHKAHQHPHEHEAHQHSHEHKAHQHSHEHKAHHHSHDDSHVENGSRCEKNSSNLNTKQKEKHISEHDRQKPCCNGSSVKSVAADNKNKTHEHSSENHKMNDHQKDSKSGHSHGKCCQH